MSNLEKVIRCCVRGTLAVLTLAPLAAVAEVGDGAAASDTALAAALAAQDAAKLSSYLDEDAWWTDARGTTLRKAALAERVPAPLIANLATAETSWHTYGPVSVAQSHTDRAHVVRIWVERDGGPRLLAYQEVRSLAAPPAVTPGTAGDCDNPCRKVGIDPENETQAAVIRAYQELEISAEERDIELWSARIADEFIAASSNSDHLFDKPTRIAGLKQNAMRGLSPTALVSGKIYDFGNAAVMVSEHLSARGQSLHVTRVWVRRDGQWMETLSYQTARREAP